MAELTVEILVAAIKKHREQSGHNLCWLNDLELWKVIDPDATYPHDKVPGREEFLSQCARYHESRVCNLPYVEAEQKTCAVTRDGKRVDP